MMVDLLELEGTLDLWSCMWDADEQDRFETALVRCMTNEHQQETRLLAFAACNVIATPRLLAAALRVVEQRLLPREVVSGIEEETVPLYKRLAAAERLRGNCARVETLLRRAIAGHATDDEAHLLDWVDLRDLVTVARTSVDARIYAEVERRVARRGKYQRGRAAKVLGFRSRTPPPARVRAA